MDMRAMRNKHDDSTPLAPPPALDPRRHALFLDLDGSLLEIEQHPQDVRASAALRELLQQISAAMSGAVALITGRTVDDADRILHGALGHIAGVHGSEVLHGGQVTRAKAQSGELDAAREDVRRLLAQDGVRALVEDKGASLALHYRQTPEAEAPIKRIAAEIAAARGLRLLEGKMVVELVAGARTKGDALAGFMAQPPFAGRAPVAVGDDRTDEDAFAACNRLGGWGVLVGAPRESAASFALADPAAVGAWLERSLPR